MDLLDRYLQSVKKHLPWQRQDDIVAELRANLEAQLEEKEAALGRPLTKAEAEAWIKQLGLPVHMAAPYLPQQYLIGPAMFPIYLHVLKLACSWALAIYCIVNAVQFFLSKAPSAEEIARILLHVPVTLVYTAAWCTLIFAILEYCVNRGYVKIPALEPLYSAWSPADLPFADARSDGPKKPRRFAAALAEVVFGFIFMAWLLLFPHNHWLLMGPGAIYLDASPYGLAPIWTQFYWCAVVLNALQLAWHILDLAQGTWRQPSPFKSIVFKIFGLACSAVLLTAPGHALAVLKNPLADQAHYGAWLASTNFYAYRGVAVVMAIVVVQLIWEISQLGLNAYRSRADAH